MTWYVPSASDLKTDEAWGPEGWSSNREMSGFAMQVDSRSRYISSDILTIFAPSPFKPDALHNELHNAFSLQPKVDERPTFLAVF